MTTQQDSAFGLKKETTFATYVAPDKFFEFLEEDFAWAPTFSEGGSQRYGKRMAMANRRVLVKEETTGTVTVEMLTKGLGALFEAVLGTGTSTLISGSAYQQLFTMARSDQDISSYTIQKGIPLVGGGATQPQSFPGCVCTGFEIASDNSGIPTIKFNWLGSHMETDEAFVAPSYAANLELLTFVGGSIRIGGAVTPPTTTALAVGGTVAANVLSVNLTFDNGMDTGGFALGSGGRRGRTPKLGTRVLTGTFTAEYDSNVYRDAFLNQDDLALVLQFTHPSIISGAIHPTLEVTLPVIRLDGEVPKAAAGAVITQTVGFTCLDGQLATDPLYIAIVTAETAI